MPRTDHDVPETAEITVGENGPVNYTIGAMQPGRFTDYNASFVTLIHIDFAAGEITHAKNHSGKREMLNRYSHGTSIMLAVRIGYPDLYLVNQGDARMDVFGGRRGPK